VPSLTKGTKERKHTTQERCNGYEEMREENQKDKWEFTHNTTIITLFFFSTEMCGCVMLGESSSGSGGGRYTTLL
jgi:hypothetical protein